MEQTLPHLFRSQVVQLHRLLTQPRNNQTIIRHPKSSHRLAGHRFKRTFAIFASCLLVESMILQILTSVPVEQPRFIAQEETSTGQVAGVSTSQTTTKPAQPILNNQVRAATITPTPAPTPSPFTNPLRHYTITQYYSSYHPAIDMAAPYGSPVYSINHGTVVGTGYILAGGGLMVKIQHRHGYYSYYAHLSSIQVTTGQAVTSQTQIGRIGSTGWSTGPHLHLIIEQGGRYLNPLAIIK